MWYRVAISWIGICGCIQSTTCNITIPWCSVDHQLSLEEFLPALTPPVAPYLRLNKASQISLSMRVEPVVASNPNSTIASATAIQRGAGNCMTFKIGDTRRLTIHNEVALARRKSAVEGFEVAGLKNMNKAIIWIRNFGPNFVSTPPQQVSFRMSLAQPKELWLQRSDRDLVRHSSLVPV